MWVVSLRLVSCPKDVSSDLSECVLILCVGVDRIFTKMVKLANGCSVMEVSTTCIPTMRSKLGDVGVDIMTHADKTQDSGITLPELVRRLREIFSADSVNVEHVSELLASYRSNPTEWKQYAKFDPFKYTRNLVDEGNGKFNLMILCWGEGHGSSVHDHANAHCFMKMLSGSLAEIRFAWPEESRTGSSVAESDDEDMNHEGLKELSRSSLNTNDVAYINDSLGLHRVENLSHTEKAVSLHLYCPPFDSCNVFNQKTGKRSEAKVTFWSKYGEKANKEEIIASRVPEDN